STMLIGGVVCYSNKSKMKLLNVKEETINTYGVVSEQCAEELAENVRNLLGTSIGISFTGVAGPDSLKVILQVQFGLVVHSKANRPKLIHYNWLVLETEIKKDQ